MHKPLASLEEKKTTHTQTNKKRFHYLLSEIISLRRQGHPYSRPLGLIKRTEASADVAALSNVSLSVQRSGRRRGEAGWKNFFFIMTGPFHFDHLFSHGEKPHCLYPGIAPHAFVLVGHSILHLIHADR